MSARWLVVAIAGLVAGAGCNTILGIDLEYRLASGGGGAGGAGGSASGGGGASGCPSEMRLVDDSFCVDRTEVRNADYQAFLDASPAPPSVQRCAFKQGPEDLTPSGWPPPAGSDDLPVAFVDWCDALAYCSWAGKQLCGSPLGGATSQYDSRDESMWFAACTADGSSYPYGDSYQQGSCVDRAYSGTSGLDAEDVAQPVGSALACRGSEAPHDGIFDMVGNLAEWEDECTQAGCRVRGGSFSDNENNARCQANERLGEDSRSDDVGFRCCRLP